MRHDIERDLMNETTTSPQVILVTDLGEGNIGAISAAEVSAERKQQLIEDVVLSRNTINEQQTLLFV